MSFRDEGSILLRSNYTELIGVAGWFFWGSEQCPAAELRPESPHADTLLPPRLTARGDCKISAMYSSAFRKAGYWPLMSPEQALISFASFRADGNREIASIIILGETVTGRDLLSNQIPGVTQQIGKDLAQNKIAK